MQVEMLAMTLEEVKTLFGAVQLFLTLGMTAFLAFVNGKTKKIDALEASQGKLADEVKRAASDLMDQKLATQRAVFDIELKNTREQLADVREDLRRGATRFAIGEKAQHDLEVNVLKALNDLKDKVATKDDLKSLREELRSDG